jgi:hypothetical protein
MSFVLETSPSRPQREAESVAGSAIALMELARRVTMAYHSDCPVETKAKLFDCLKRVNEEILPFSETLHQKKVELSRCLHGEYPSYYLNSWAQFLHEFERIVQNFNMQAARITTFEDVLLQLKEDTEMRRRIESDLRRAKKRFRKIGAILEKMSNETAESTVNSIIATIALERNISFEEAERIHFRRWTD